MELADPKTDLEGLLIKFRNKFSWSNCFWKSELHDFLRHNDIIEDAEEIEIILRIWIQAGLIDRYEHNFTNDISTTGYWFSPSADKLRKG